MIKRFFSLILAVIMFIFGAIPVEATSHDYDIIDYVTDGTITNVVSSYANMLYNQFPKPSDVISIIGGNGNEYTQKKQDSVNEFANSLIVNSDNLRTAIENGYVDLDGRAKEIWNNLFNNHRGKNLVFSPDIGDMDFIRPLINRVVNYRVLDNDRGGYPDIEVPTEFPAITPSAEAITYEQLVTGIANSDLYGFPYSNDNVMFWIRLQLNRSASFYTTSFNFLRTHKFRYFYILSGLFQRNSSSDAEEFSIYFFSNRNLSFSYSFNSSRNQYGLRFLALNSVDDDRIFSYGACEMSDGSSAILSHSSNSSWITSSDSASYIWANLPFQAINNDSLRAVKYAIAYPDENKVDVVVNNTVNNFYENIENIYNTDIVNNYYPSEIFIPSVDNGGVINHNDNSLNIDLSKNNDITNIVNNYVYNNYYSYGGDTHNNNYTYVTNIESILPPEPPTNPVDPVDPEPNKPDPTDPTDPEDLEDSEDGWPDWFKKIIEFLRGIFDIDILDWLKSLLDSILEFLKLLFVPEDGFFENELAKMYSNLLLSLPVDSQLNALMSLAGSNSVSISVSDYNIFSDSEKINYAFEVLNINTMSSTTAFEDINITFMGNEITFISSAFINRHIDTIRSFTGGILTLIMIAYNLDQIHLFFRNTRLFSPSKGIDTSDSGRKS